MTPRRAGGEVPPTVRAEQGMAPNQFLEEQLTNLRREGSGWGGTAAFAAALWRRSKSQAAARPDLVRELRAVRRLGVLVAVVTGLALRLDGVPTLPALWLPALAWLLLCGWVWAELGLVRHPLTDAPGRHLGPANVMTLYRGWASVPALLLAFWRPGPTVTWVGVCFIAGVTDLLDGTVAIRLGHESRLGRLLDPVMDACFFSAAAYSLARWHLLPAWLAALVTIRYFAPVIGGLGLLLATGRSVPVRHTPWGQRSTAATALALFTTWAATFLTLPGWLLPGLYGVAVVFMVLALAGILRRAPRSG